MSYIFPPAYQFLDSNGDPIASGKAFFYVTGTTTKKKIYSDLLVTTTATNPQTLDSSGRFDTDLFGIGEYTVKVNNADGKTVFTRNNVNVESANKNKTTYELGTTAAAAFHPSIITGHLIETSYLDSNRTFQSGGIVRFTGTTTGAKKTNWPNTTDGFFYDGDGKKFVVDKADVRKFGARQGTGADSKAFIETCFNHCRDEGVPMYMEGQYRTDSAMTWTASGGLNNFVAVYFQDARITKNHSGIGLTCAGGSTFQNHYGQLTIDKMTNLGDGTGGNATAGDNGFVQNCRIARYGQLLLEDHTDDAYEVNANTNMNATNLGHIRIRSCDAKGFNGTGTQDDCAVWTGRIDVNDVYKAGIFLADNFNARAWDMHWHAENCAQDGTSDQVYTGGMSASRITVYTEDNSAGSGTELHVPSGTSLSEFFTWRHNEVTFASTTSRLYQGSTERVAANTHKEATVACEGFSNSSTRILTKSWEGSSSAILVQRAIDGSGRLEYKVTGRTTSDVLSTRWDPDTAKGWLVLLDDSAVFSISTAGVIRHNKTPSTRDGAGAIDITEPITWIVTDSNPDALTIADGAEGQRKSIVMKTDVGDGVLTPANLAGGATITFDDVGDSCELLFTNGSWHFMGGTATLA